MLLTHVRRAIRLAVWKMLRPMDPAIEVQRCSSWSEIKTHYPHVSVGQLERVIHTAAAATLRRLVTEIVSTPAVNDAMPPTLCSYPGAFPCGMAVPDCERCAPLEGSWLAVRASR